MALCNDMQYDNKRNVGGWVWVWVWVFIYVNITLPDHLFMFYVTLDPFPVESRGYFVCNGIDATVASMGGRMDLPQDLFFLFFISNDFWVGVWVGVWVWVCVGVCLYT